MIKDITFKHRERWVSYADLVALLLPELSPEERAEVIVRTYREGDYQQPLAAGHGLSFSWPLDSEIEHTAVPGEAMPDNVVSILSAGGGEPAGGTGSGG